MSFKSIAEAKHLSGKTVLVRLDINVPLKGKHVLDDTRLREAAPTIRLLERRGANVILIGHLGRPKGKLVPGLSLKPVGYALGKILRQPVKVLPLSQKAEAIKRASQAGLVLLENIRFEPGEEKNSPTLARTLARLGDVYVNEAFSVSHHASVSMVGLAKKLPAYAGLQLRQELAALEKLRQGGAKPVVAIIGGAKIRDKLPVIAKFLPRLSSVLVGGGVANTLLKAKGYKVARSLVDTSTELAAKRLLKGAGKKLLLPVDVVVDKAGTKRAESWWRPVNEIRARDRIVDLGTATCRRYAQDIKKAKTIFWSGPLGLIEEPNCRHATLALGRLVAALSRRKAYVVVGGGETVAFFHQHSLRVDFFSTGGGAMLAFLAGEELPGLTALGYYHQR